MTSCWTNQSITVNTAASLFFPVSKELGISPNSQLSPGFLKKVIYAGIHATSFRQAEEFIRHLAEQNVSSQRIRRAVKKVGQTSVKQRDQRVKEFQNLPLTTQKTSPRDQVPAVACIQIDGGRIQIRPRVSTEESGTRVDGLKGRFWRETKIGCLLSMISDIHSEDPCPMIPRTFVDTQRMRAISSEIKGFFSDADTPESESETAQVKNQSDRKGRPEPLVKSIVATCQRSDIFGKQVATAAYHRGFAAAERKAFIGDGMACNWTIWRNNFSHYTPILDFVHAICYVYAAAMVTGTTATNWALYCRWAQWVWEGNVAKVIEGVIQQQQIHGFKDESLPDGAPGNVLAESLRYLTNQQERMKYNEYRKQGLPITSSYIESTIKQVNRRVKGTEKFWSNTAEEILQLVGVHLSQTNELAEFWGNYTKELKGIREYKSAV